MNEWVCECVCKCIYECANIVKEYEWICLYKLSLTGPTSSIGGDLGKNYYSLSYTSILMIDKEKKLKII